MVDKLDIKISKESQWIMDEVRKSLEEIKREAYQEGYDKGYGDGHDAGREEGKMEAKQEFYKKEKVEFT